MKKKEVRRTRDQYTVVLEDIRDKITLVAEATQPIPLIQKKVEAIPKIREKLDATFEEVGGLLVRTTAVEAALKILGRDVGSLKQDMQIVKGDLRTIKNDLKAKVDRDEFKVLEERVERLEATVRTR